MKTIFIVLAAVLLLAGCKAKEVELRVDTQDLQDALAGDDVTARFIARFESFGTLDEEKRAQLDSVQAIVEDAFELEDYNMVADSSQVTITVEGELPIYVGEPGGHDDAFALYIWPIDNELLPGFSHALQLNVGKGFDPLQAAMQKVSYMLAIDAVQPVMYRLRANSGAPIPILAGGAQLDGTGFAVRAFSIEDGDRINLTFKGGAYDAVFGGMLLSLPAN
ncbi:hypothetical protein [Devosia ginsengisoli]|uniref:hypothetical protein n=1 Tax=Devosia ginsengisoli TaxID=400770 RepID=UPI0026EAB61D|nr:hypothetical protein [Devosia ginsengisoli]MCR6672210.1 hypothetical protein [Devosia ginsengisoli]